MSKPPEWPYRCPRDGKYLSKVDAIFTDDLDFQHGGDGCDPHVPLLVYGMCKLHGNVWLHDRIAYQPHLWKEKYELRVLDRAGLCVDQSTTTSDT